MRSLQISLVLAATITTPSFAQRTDHGTLKQHQSTDEAQVDAERSLKSARIATESPITAAAFSPDGKSVVAVSQSGLHVYSWPALNRQRTIKSSAANLHCVEFSPNGKHIAIGGGNPSEDGIVELLSWPAGESLTKFDDHSDSVRSVAWLNDTRLLTASIDREIKLWDLEMPTNPILTLEGHSRSVHALCLLKDNKTLISAGIDQSVRVWDFKSGKLIRSMNQHIKPIHALAMRPGVDGLPMIASAAGDRTIRFWQPTIGRMVRYVRLDAEPLDIAWLSDGSRIVASCVDGRIRVVDPDEVKVTQTLHAMDGWAYTVAVHASDGSILVGGSNGHLGRVIP
ncbi:MAG: WD40 repeat domain-containing protein [Planctomycetes bacterium]|nr:WD40 repeat domain-containing protein [Planctomycetota bacterium]